jgi:hypothetical protein
VEVLLRGLHRTVPAVAISAIGDAPVAARFVNAVCRMTWNVRTRPSIPAAASAFWNSPWYERRSTPAAEVFAKETE